MDISATLAPIITVGANLAQLIVAVASIIALLLTLRELRATRQYQRENTQVSRSQIVTDILLSILSNAEERSFFLQIGL
jgi:uncharacterized membrane protein YciS (DUF1049 family)